MKRLEILTKTARSSNEAMVADAGQTSATTLVTAKQNFLPDNPGQPTTQGNGASAQSDSETRNQHNATQRQRTSKSSHKSSENQRENVTYPNSITTAPIAQLVRPPATGQQSSYSNAHDVAKTSGSSNNTPSAVE